ncbi:MAG: 50S ribosomal protein L29, partial [Propioniciclava sp.]|nr:50S ribosomal protein L29 [Propioniciclava sp.]
QLDNTARVARTKRDIARLLTELRAREIAAAEAAAGGEA